MNQQPMYNQPMYPQQNPYMGGYPQYPQYAQYQPRPQAKGYQPLSAEQIKDLRSKVENIDWRVSQEQLNRSICTHKENGQLTLSECGDGTVKCSICGAKFHLNQFNKQDVTEATNHMLDILQNIKTIYGDIPPALAQNFFQIIPLLEKVPAMYDVAANNFDSYDNPQGANGVYYNGYQPNSFAVIGQMMNPYGYMNQPMAGYYQQPAPVQPQPAGQVGYGNPFVAAPAYGQPQPMAQAPMAPQFAPQQMPMAPDAGAIPMMNNMNMQQPQQMPQQPAPVAPNTGDVVQQNKTFQA